MSKRLGLILVVVALAVTAIVVHALGYEGRRDSWRALGVDDYTWTLDIDGAWIGSYRLTARVRDGQPVRATLLAEGERVKLDGAGARIEGDRITFDGAYSLPATVDDLFDRLIDLADAADETGDTQSLEVHWNDEFGYPSLIRFGADDAMFDNEMTYEVVAFKAQQPRS